MTVALATRWFGVGTSLGQAARAARELGLAHLALDLPGPVASAPREELKELGVRVSAVLPRGGVGAAAEDPRAFVAAFETHAAVAARLRADLVVVDGGTVGGRADRDLGRRDGVLVSGGGAEEAREVEGLRAGLVAPAVERAARALHGAVRAGVPVVVRNGRGAADALAFEETGWLLDALPRLGLAFDPTHALRLNLLGLGPPAEAWAERFASRTAAVFAHGLGADREGGSHPEDEAPPWAVLREILPERAVRILDLDPTLSGAEVADAVRFVLHEAFPTSRA